MADENGGGDVDRADKADQGGADVDPGGAAAAGSMGGGAPGPGSDFGPSIGPDDIREDPNLGINIGNPSLKSLPDEPGISKTTADWLGRALDLALGFTPAGAINTTAGMLGGLGKRAGLDLGNYSTTAGGLVSRGLTGLGAQQDRGYDITPGGTRGDVAPGGFAGGDRGFGGPPGEFDSPQVAAALQHPAIRQLLMSLMGGQGGGMQSFQYGGEVQGEMPFGAPQDGLMGGSPMLTSFQPMQGVATQPFGGASQAMAQAPSSPMGPMQSSLRPGTIGPVQQQATQMQPGAAMPPTNPMAMPHPGIPTAQGPMERPMGTMRGTVGSSQGGMLSPMSQRGLQSMRTGGQVQGSNTPVPIIAHPGEVVIPAHVVRRYADKQPQRLSLQSGGPVGSYQEGGPIPMPPGGGGGQPLGAPGGVGPVDKWWESGPGGFGVDTTKGQTQAPTGPWTNFQVPGVGASGTFQRGTATSQATYDPITQQARQRAFDLFNDPTQAASIMKMFADATGVAPPDLSRLRSLQDRLMSTFTGQMTPDMRQAVGMMSQTGDPTRLGNAYRDMFQTIAGPRIANTLAAQGIGGGGVGEALSRAGAQMAPEVESQALQGQRMAAGLQGEMARFAPQQQLQAMMGAGGLEAQGTDALARFLGQEAMSRRGLAGQVYGGPLGLLHPLQVGGETTQTGGGVSGTAGLTNMMGRGDQGIGGSGINISDIAKIISQFSGGFGTS